MKTLTITISDQTARNLRDAAIERRQTVEQLAAEAVEQAVTTDWLDELDDEARAAIDAGVAEADQGDFASEEEVNRAFDRFKR